MEFFEFTVTEIRQKTVRIEAETYGEATSLAEELWHEGHDVCALKDKHLIVTRIIRSDDNVHRILADSEDGESIQVIVLEPDRKARLCCTKLSYETLSTCGIKLYISQIDDDIYIMHGDSKTLNRAVRARDGSVSEVTYGTAFICRFDGERLVSLSDEEAERYLQIYESPDELIVVDGLVTAIPRQK